ncbi:dihydroneopterin triphosphate diphosphatase [Zoogloea sp.]|jgi:dATP pyrophosphohydrolase|uniref:dihydroneopterin triphosphate diphosphatase n=1 Tax=Zoogloea sp. TaxID=49181 RepID=UPI0037DA257A
MSEGAKQPISVLVVIHTPGLDVLVMERAGGTGLWQSVTGSREGDEVPVATALREVAEETGIIATGDDLIDWRLSNRFLILPRWRQRYAPGVTHNTEHLFSLCLPAPVAPSLAPDEHTAACWLPWQEAAERVFSWTNRDAIRLLARRFSPAA